MYVSRFIRNERILDKYFMMMIFTIIIIKTDIQRNGETWSNLILCCSETLEAFHRLTWYTLIRLTQPLY